MRESSKFRQGVQLCYRLLYSVQRGVGLIYFSMEAKVRKSKKNSIKLKVDR